MSPSDAPPLGVTARDADFDEDAWLSGAYERISGEVRLTPTPDLPDDLADRVLALRAEEDAKRRQVRIALGIAGGAACLFALLVLAALVEMI